ncbi:MAG: methyltransferase domain-containing protein [Bacteroidota bacterium]
MTTPNISFAWLGLGLCVAFMACQPAADCPCDCDELGPQPMDRTAWQQPGVVIDILGDLEEKVVADIGAGGGFFALRLARLADRVIAVEVEQSFINRLNNLADLELPNAQRGRFEARLAPYENPNLQAEEVDLVLLVNTFYVIQSEDYLRAVYPGLKPGGRIVIVDWKDRYIDLRTPNLPDRSERISIGETERMLEGAGFELVRSYDNLLDYQYVVVAEKK